MNVVFKLGIVLLLANLISSACMAAGGKCGKNLKWNLENGILTISGEGEMDNFSHSDQPWRIALVKEVRLEHGITSIGTNAFSGAKITAIDVPDGVTKIGDYAFKGCDKIAIATLPYGLKVLGKQAFAKCTSMLKVNIPASVKTIGERCFKNCGLITEIALPPQLSFIGSKAFDGCVRLSEISTMPDMINRTNCGEFGITYSLVDDYNNKSQSVSVTSFQESTSKEGGNIIKSAKSTSSELDKAQSAPVYGTVDIDVSIPKRSKSSLNTFAIIIANEHYSSIADVPFAINDGKSVEAYFRNTLGIPKENINFYQDATLGNMRHALAYIKEVDNVYDGKINLLVYYAGHGAPDEKSKETFLIPTDSYKVQKDVCLPMTEFYQTLGSLKAKSVKVFLDACFSGAIRTGDMIAENRSVAMNPKPTRLSGNVAVISATTEDQTAWQYTGKGHGLFTYYLLKKLQETKGEASMGEIADYLKEKVSQKSIVENRRVQTPTSIVSDVVKGSWRSWQLK